MRVLIVNKFFFPHAGAESVFFASRRILSAKGHEVIDFAMAHPRNAASPYSGFFAPEVDFSIHEVSYSALRAAAHLLYSEEAAACLQRLIREHRPTIAHLHNIYHQLTPSIIRVLRRQGIPVVMTLHDFKLVCPAYTLSASGQVCERCAGGRYIQGVLARCRGGGRSALLAMESYLHHDLLRSYQDIASFLSPSRFLKEQHHRMGFRHPIEVLPNPLPFPLTIDRPPRGDHFLFVGRLAPEKGVSTLCAAAALAGCSVHIVGDGPELSLLQQRFAAVPNIRFLGRVNPIHVPRLMETAAALVVPSVFYENQPMVVLESFACGTPVIAAAIGGIPELVSEGETGLLFAPGDPEALADKLRWARAHTDEMRQLGERARKAAARFDPEVHYRGLLAIYQRALGGQAQGLEPR